MYTPQKKNFPGDIGRKSNFLHRAIFLFIKFCLKKSEVIILLCLYND